MLVPSRAAFGSGLCSSLSVLEAQGVLPHAELIVLIAAEILGGLTLH